MDRYPLRRVGGLRRAVLGGILIAVFGVVSFGQGVDPYAHGSAAVRVGWAGAFDTAVLGPTILSDRETMVSGSAEVRPFRYIGFEFDASGMHRHEESSSGQVTSQGSALFLDGNLVVHPPVSSRFQPYAFGGAGDIVLKEEVALPTGTRYGRIFTVGGGADTRLFGRFYLRTEARSFSPRIYNKVLQLSVGLACHW